MKDPFRIEGRLFVHVECLRNQIGLNVCNRLTFFVDNGIITSNQIAIYFYSFKAIECGGVQLGHVCGLVPGSQDTL